MRLAGPVPLVAGAVVAAVFAARAATGLIAVSAYDRGQALAGADRHAEAVPPLDRGAVGAGRTAAIWWAGQELLAQWDVQPGTEELGPRGSEWLRGAALRFLAGRAASPSDSAFTSGLSEVYARRESIFRHRRTVDLVMIERGAWALVGDDGRIAIGLARAAVARMPNEYTVRDRLMFMLETNGLREEALKAIEDCARVLPDFNQHSDFVLEELPRELVEAFWRTSRSLPPEAAPLQFRERHLLSLGQLGRWLGHLEEAEQDLRAALAATGTAIFHAEDAYHLGLVLLDRGRLDEAEAMLERARGEPVFEPLVAEAQGRIAEKRERWPEALDHFREARRLQPRELRFLLQFARAAERVGAWDQAEEALRWSIVVSPEDPAPRRALIEMFVSHDRHDLARKALNDYILALGKGPETAQLEQMIGAKLDPAVR